MRRCLLAILVATTLGLALLLYPPTAAAAGGNISLSPSSGPAGSTVRVIGTGWEEHGSSGIDVPITVAGSPVAVAHPNAAGTFRLTIKIPASASGSVEVSAIIGNGGAASAQFTVTDGTTGGQDGCPVSPSIGIKPDVGPPGKSFVIQGSRWAPGGTVRISLPYGSKGIFNTTSASPSVGTHGGWQTVVKVGSATPRGNYQFTAIESTSRCGTITKTVVFAVTTG
ncbi:IPT/TIG domain-containing protein [Streptomyces sp. NPDC048352]|uniref:IPT/TIG domain-containing protein n=1 Tax=Streptomyces sp. NPDC048352 TaxID=3154718 RepID=UPI00342A6658